MLIAGSADICFIRLWLNKLKLIPLVFELYTKVVCDDVLARPVVLQDTTLTYFFPTDELKLE